MYSSLDSSMVGASSGFVCESDAFQEREWLGGTNTFLSIRVQKEISKTGLKFKIGWI